MYQSYRNLRKLLTNLLIIQSKPCMFDIIIKSKPCMFDIVKTYNPNKSYRFSLSRKASRPFAIKHRITMSRAEQCLILFQLHCFSTTWSKGKLE